MQPNLVRLLLSCLLSLCLPLAVLGGCVAASGTPTFPPPTEGWAGRQVGQQVGEVGERPTVRALRILRGWDRRRASAYSTGDARGLRRLYAPGSRAGARDVALLQRYADRGLVVERLSVQVLRARLVSATPSMVRLRVVDRLAGGTVAGDGGGGVTLPSGRPAARVITLVDVGPRWVVRAVRRG